MRGSFGAVHVHGRPASLCGIGDPRDLLRVTVYINLFVGALPHSSKGFIHGCVIPKLRWVGSNLQMIKEHP